MELSTDEARAEAKTFDFGEAMKNVLRLGGVKLDKEFLVEVYSQYFSVRNFVCNIYVYYYVRIAQVAHEYVAHASGDAIAVHARKPRRKSWIL